MIFNLSVITMLSTKGGVLLEDLVTAAASASTIVSTKSSYTVNTLESTCVRIHGAGRGIDVGRR